MGKINPPLCQNNPRVIEELKKKKESPTNCVCDGVGQQKDIGMRIPGLSITYYPCINLETDNIVQMSIHSFLC